MEKVKNLIVKAKEVLKGVVESPLAKLVVDVLKWVVAYAVAAAIAVALCVGVILFSIGIAAGVLLIAVFVAQWLAELLGLGLVWAVAFFFALVLFVVVRK